MYVARKYYGITIFKISPMRARPVCYFQTSGRENRSRSRFSEGESRLDKREVGLHLITFFKENYSPSNAPKLLAIGTCSCKRVAFRAATSRYVRRVAHMHQSNGATW